MFSRTAALVCLCVLASANASALKENKAFLSSQYLLEVEHGVHVEAGASASKKPGDAVMFAWALIPLAILLGTSYCVYKKNADMSEAGDSPYVGMKSVCCCILCCCGFGTFLGLCFPIDGEAEPEEETAKQKAQNAMKAEAAAKENVTLKTEEAAKAVEVAKAAEVAKAEAAAKAEEAAKAEAIAKAEASNRGEDYAKQEANAEQRAASKLSAATRAEAAAAASAAAKAEAMQMAEEATKAEEAAEAASKAEAEAKADAITKTAEAAVAEEAAVKEAEEQAAAAAQAESDARAAAEAAAAADEAALAAEAAKAAASWAAGQMIVVAAGQEEAVKGKCMMLSQDKVEGVHDAVVTLNTDKALCDAGICTVFSKSDKQVVILYRSDKKEEATKLSAIV